MMLVGVPRHILPEVRDTTGPFCSTDAKSFGAVIPVNVVVGEGWIEILIDLSCNS